MDKRQAIKKVKFFITFIIVFVFVSSILDAVFKGFQLKDLPELFIKAILTATVFLIFDSIIGIINWIDKKNSKNDN